MRCQDFPIQPLMPLDNCPCIEGKLLCNQPYSNHMGNMHDNIVYEIEMIGGGLLVLLSGLYLWKRSGLKNKVEPIE